MSELDRSTSTILDRAVQTQDGEAPATVLDALNALQGDSSSDLPVPAAPATPAAPTAPAGAAPTAPADTAPAANSASDLPVPEAPAPVEQQPAAPATN